MEAKDYKYIIGYFILAIIGIFTFFYGTDKNQIVSYIGFAGTITSIFLSVIAVIYTFYQSTSSINYTKKLSETSDDFQGAVEELKETQAQIAASVSAMVALSQQVASVDNKVERLSTFLETPNSPHNVVREVGIQIDHEQLISLLSTTSPAGIVSLIVACYHNKNPIASSLPEIIEKLGDINGITSQYSFGYLVAFSTLGFINVYARSDSFSVTIYDTEFFKDAISKAIHNFSRENCALFFSIEQSLKSIYELDLSITS